MPSPICAIIDNCVLEEEKPKQTKNPCAAASCNAKSYKNGCVPHCGVGKSKDYCKAVCLVCNRKKINANPIYTEQLKSGYMGHVPMSNFQLGLSFPEAGIIGIAEFEAARNTKIKCRAKINGSTNNSNNNNSSNSSNGGGIGGNGGGIGGNGGDLKGNGGGNVAVTSHENTSSNNDKAVLMARNTFMNFNFKSRDFNGLRRWRYNMINIPETAGLEADHEKQEDGIRCVICPCPVPVPIPDMPELPPKSCPNSCIRCKTDPRKSGTPMLYRGPCLKGCDGFYCPIPYEKLTGGECDENNSNSTKKCSILETCLTSSRLGDCSKTSTQESSKFLFNNNNESEATKVKICAYPQPTPCCQYPCNGEPCGNPCCYDMKCCTQKKRSCRGSMKNYECCPTPTPRPLFLYYTEKAPDSKCESESPTAPPNCCFMPCAMTKECCGSCCPCGPCGCGPCGPVHCPNGLSFCGCTGTGCCGCCGPCCSPCGNCSNNKNAGNTSNNAEYLKEEEDDTSKKLCDCNIHTCVPSPAFIAENVVCPCPCMPDRPKQLVLTRNPPKTIPVNCCSCCKPAVPFNAGLYPKIANKAIQTWANAKQRTIAFELTSNKDYVLPEDPNKCIDASLIY